MTTQAFLFGWNPVKWAWPELSEDIAALRRGEKFIEDWSCASHKKVRPGDRAFVMHVGANPRGIFASGHIASESFIGKNRKGNDAFRVLIDFDVLLNPSQNEILTLDLLAVGRMAKQVWTPQSSGISIKQNLVDELEALWQDFLKHREK